MCSCTVCTGLSLKKVYASLEYSKKYFKYLDSWDKDVKKAKFYVPFFFILQTFIFWKKSYLPITYFSRERILCNIQGIIVSLKKQILKWRSKSNSRYITSESLIQDYFYEVRIFYILERIIFFWTNQYDSFDTQNDSIS